MLFFILFMIHDIEATADVTLSYSYPSSDLFFVHSGFANPAISRGLIGFGANPAALTSAKSSEVMVCYAPSLKTRINTEFIIPFDSLESVLDTIRIPTRLSLEQTGGIDFVGFLLKAKGWRMAIGGQKGDYLGLNCSAEVRPSAQYDIDYDDTLTHDLISELPPSDSIPVHLHLQGSGSLGLNGTGSGYYQNRSLVLAVANRILGLDIGIGWQFTPVEISGNFNTFLSGATSNDLELVVSQSSDWTINADIDVEIDADSVIRCDGNADLSFYMSTFTWGLKKEWRYLSFGFSGELSAPTFIQGNWALTTFLPSEIPLIRLEDDSLQVDTIRKEITGHAKVIVYGFETEDTTRQGVGKTPFLGTAGFNGGFELRIWRFDAGCFGGLSTSSNGSYMRAKLGLNLGLRLFVPLRCGAILHFQSFNAGGFPVTALPVLAVGAGTDFSIKRLSFFFNVSANTTQGAATLVVPGIVGGETVRSSLLALGFGLRYSF